MTRFDDAIDLAQIATPSSNPASGRSKLFLDTDGIPKLLRSSGVVDTAAGTRWGFTDTWAFADTTDVNAIMSDGLPPRVGDLLISRNGFSYGAVHRIIAVGAGPTYNVDIDGTILFTINGTDTGWQNVTFDAGWANYGSGFHTCQYRRVNDVLYLKGLLKRTGGTAGGLLNIFTLPVGCRPTGLAVMASWGNPTTAGETSMTVYVQTNGSVSCSSHAIATNGYLYINVVVPAVG